MSDRARRLERQADGDLEENGRGHQILECLRACTPTEDAARLAAYLRDPWARLQAKGVRHKYEGTPPWLGLLADRWPLEPAIRVTNATAHRALDRWEPFALDRWNQPIRPNWQYRPGVHGG